MSALVADNTELQADNKEMADRNLVLSLLCRPSLLPDNTAENNTLQHGRPVGVAEAPGPKHEAAQDHDGSPRGE